MDFLLAKQMYRLGEGSRVFWCRSDQKDTLHLVLYTTVS